MPQNSHGKPIHAIPVPVKVSVAVELFTSDASRVPLLDVTPVWLSATVDHGPLNVIPVSSTRVTVGPPPVTVKLLALVAVPPGVVTLIGPAVAPPGTLAVIDVAEFTVKLAPVPLNR